MKPSFPLALTLLAALAGCEAPSDAAFPPSEAARAAPPPQLAETARFAAPLAQAAPDAERLSADADALAARAAALRSRAEALSEPVLAPAARRRMEEPPRQGDG